MKPRTRSAVALALTLAIGLAACSNDTEVQPPAAPPTTSDAVPTDPGRPAVVRPAIRPDAEFKGRPYAPGAEVVFGIDHDTKLGSNVAKVSDLKATCWGSDKTLRVEVSGPKGWKATIVPTAYGAGTAEVSNPDAGYSTSTVGGDEAAVNRIKDAIRDGRGENSIPVYGMTIKTNEDVRVEILKTRKTQPVNPAGQGFPLDWAPKGAAVDSDGNGPEVTFALFLNLSCGEG